MRLSFLKGQDLLRSPMGTLATGFANKCDYVHKGRIKLRLS